MRHVRLDLIILTARVYKLLKRNQPKTSGISDNLAGACAIGADLLYQQLKKFGFTPTLVEGSSGIWGHCWVEVSGHICDPTFEQFKFDRGYLVERTELAMVMYPKAYSDWKVRTKNPDLDFEWDYSVAPCGPNGRLISERFEMQGSRTEKFII